MLRELLTVLRSRRLLVVGVAVVGAIAGGLVLVDRYTGRITYTGEDGPIRAIDGLVLEGVAIDVPEQRTWGGLSLPNRHDDPITIEGFRIDPPLDGPFRFLGSLVATDENRDVAEAAAFPGYPAPHLIESLGPLTSPFEGTVIPPHSERGVVLVLGLEVTRPGVFWWDRIDIDFRFRGRSYTMQNHLGHFFCAPIAAFPDGCLQQGEKHPTAICDRVGYVPLGENGCVPPES